MISSYPTTSVARSPASLHEIKHHFVTPPSKMSAPVSENVITSEDSFYRSQYNGANADASEASNDPQSPENAPTRAGYVPFLDRLRALPEVRSIPWRPGQELPPEKSVDSPRVQQRGAILLSTRGAVTDTQCDHCAAGYGRFSVCVTLESWFQGACSSCIFTSKGNKCSLRFETSGNLLRVLYQVIAERIEGDTDGRALRYKTGTPDQASSPNGLAAEKPTKSIKLAKKRKRSSISIAPVKSTYKSIYPQLESPSSTSTDMDMLLQEQIAREQSSPDPVTHKEKLKPILHPSPAQPNVARPRGPLNGTQLPFQAPYQSPYQTPYRTPYHNEGPKSNASGSSPWDAINIIRQIVPKKEPEDLSPATTLRQDPAKNVQEPHAIDTFPKAKQRQIYGLISGLQGGIDNLEKQLGSLKTLLGIDPHRKAR